MTQFRATCDDCHKRYRVPSEERTYRCKACGGDLRADSTKLAKLTAASGTASGASSHAMSQGSSAASEGSGFVARVLGFFGFGRREVETDAVDPAASLDSMDWDAFGAPLLADSTDPMKAMPDFEPAGPAPAAPRSGVTQAQAPAPMPRSAAGDASSSTATKPGPKARVADPQPSGEADDSAPSVRSAFESFDWD